MTTCGVIRDAAIRGSLNDAIKALRETVPFVDVTAITLDGSEAVGVAEKLPSGIGDGRTTNRRAPWNAEDRAALQHMRAAGVRYPTIARVLRPTQTEIAGEVQSMARLIQA